MGCFLKGLDASLNQYFWKCNITMLMKQVLRAPPAWKEKSWLEILRHLLNRIFTCRVHSWANIGARTLNHTLFDFKHYILDAWLVWTHLYSLPSCLSLRYCRCTATIFSRSVPIFCMLYQAHGDVGKCSQNIIVLNVKAIINNRYALYFLCKTPLNSMMAVTFMLRSGMVFFELSGVLFPPYIGWIVLAKQIFVFPKKLFFFNLT